MASPADDFAEADDKKRVVNLGRTSVFLSAIEGDVRTLMRTFQRLQAYDFESFSEVWRLLNFSFIHFVATEKNTRQNFMRAIYRVVLSHFQPQAILEIRIGVIYALYLLYFTQPVNFPNINIRVTVDIWSELTNLYQYCNESEIRDVVYVFDKLIADGAFDLVAWIDDNEGILRLEGDDDGVSSKVVTKLAQIEHEIMGSSQGNVADPVSSKRQMALSDGYRNAKRRLINSNLVDQATRDFYASEFGGEMLPDSDLPTAVPLDISGRDMSWCASILTRVREYQRLRAERVGAIAEDDGSLHMQDSYLGIIGGAASSHASGLSRRVELGQSEYGQKHREYVPDPIKAMIRAGETQRVRTQRPKNA
ncbi:hypothetical protein GGI12_001236 [Dipsacomyces acuminosporus]|nr:hypothetical protein GGI12_001236 [Dipsacomyces acuminosporus]